MNPLILGDGVTIVRVIPSERTEAVELAPDGSRLMHTADHQTVTCRDIATGAALWSNDTATDGGTPTQIRYSPDGGTTSWREVNPTTWEATNKVNGKPIASYTLTLKGNSIAAVMKATKPDGSALEQSSVWNRVSGGPGFLGKWKSTEMKGAPSTLAIALDGANGLTISYPEFQIACKASFDGKDYAMTGAGATMKQTLAFEKAGPNSIKMTTKIAGKPFYVDVLTLSADGKTLTDDGSPVAAKEPVKAVYERQ